VKCILCDASTEVREVRQREDGGVRRLRQCFNGHRFTTLEQVYVSTTGRPPVGGHALRAQAVDLDQRHRRIAAELAKGRTVYVICEKYGVSPRTVQRVKAAEAAKAARSRKAAP
jgi:DNA-binding NarL/FixJ family response regulator